MPLIEANCCAADLNSTELRAVAFRDHKRRSFGSLLAPSGALLFVALVLEAGAWGDYAGLKGRATYHLGHQKWRIFIKSHREVWRIRLLEFVRTTTPFC
jgi:hypothetical protein